MKWLFFMSKVMMPRPSQQQQQASKTQQSNAHAQRQTKQAASLP